MSFTRKEFLEGITYHQQDWTDLQNNIGNYYDPLLAAIQALIDGILADYLTAAHRTEADPHPDIDIDYIKQGTAYKKITATEKGYYDLIYSTFGGAPSMDNIPDGSSYKKLTTTQETNLDTMWAAFGASPSMDNIPQGSSYIKLSAAEYAKFLTGFYDILDQTTTVKFGHNREIDAFYFAKGEDADGANIYANDIFSRGYPVYVLVFASPWLQMIKHTTSADIPHNLGYRPTFGILQAALSNPTGQPEEYIYTDGYAHSITPVQPDSYAKWNNTYYSFSNRADYTCCFRILLFAYLGS